MAVTTLDKFMMGINILINRGAKHICVGSIFDSDSIVVYGARSFGTSLIDVSDQIALDRLGWVQPLSGSEWHYCELEKESSIEHSCSL